MPKMRTPVLTGGCQCGAIRYALYTVPVGTICHCRMCQKAVGGPFAALATLARADLAWTDGAPAFSEFVGCETRVLRGLRNATDV